MQSRPRGVKAWYCGPTLETQGILCHSVVERCVLAVKQESHVEKRKDPGDRALNTMLFLKQPNEAGLPAHCTDAQAEFRPWGGGGVLKVTTSIQPDFGSKAFMYFPNILLLFGLRLPAW